MIRIKYLISLRESKVFLGLLGCTIVTGTNFPLLYIQNHMFFSLTIMLLILAIVNVIFIAAIFNSRILRDLYDKKDIYYTNALNRITAYAYSAICFNLFAAIMLLLLPQYLKQKLVLSILFGSFYLFFKGLNYFFKLFGLPRNENI